MTREEAIVVAKDINKNKTATYFFDDTDESVIVMGDLDVSDSEFQQLPVTFSVVTGHFNCSNTLLSTLHNCPRLVGKSFICDGNKNLENLDHCPIAVGRRVRFKNNSFTANLKQMLKNVEGKSWDWVTGQISLSESDKLTDLNKKTGLFD